MQRFCFRLGAVSAALGLLAGCASLPRGQGLDEVHALIEQRHGSALTWNTATADDADNADNALSTLLAQPLTADHAVAIALLHNPHLQVEFARLGIAQADVFEASRIGNPTLSVAALDPHRNGEKTRIDAGFSASFAELLLLPSRQRLALGEYARSKELIGNAVLNLLCDVRAAWFTAMSAQQVASLRETVAKVAATSAELAAKFHAAGNIAILELKLQQAAATQARIAAARARGDVIRTRSALNQLLGLSGEQNHWQADVGLPAPLASEDSVAALLAIAREQRLDLLATQQEVTLLEDGLGITQRVRWLGNVDIGVSGERDTDGTHLYGPSLSLQLPIFSQGQAAIARAEAQLAQGRARLQSLQIAIDAAVRLGFDSVAAASAIAQDYRAALVPEREAIVAHTLDKMNFNLVGAFELLLTRQQEVDAYQGYIEAVRDYWLARIELARAVGARLPSDDAANAAPIDMPELFDATPSDEIPAQHDMHHGDRHATLMLHDSPAAPSTPAAAKKIHAGAKP